MSANHADTEPVSRRRGYLAMALQEVFTAAVRLRTDRMIEPDALAFRNRIKQQLAAADAEARRAGYGDEDVKYALYAAIAFLDETVLNSAQPVFGEWHRQPLQEEVFGGHVGGELFFQTLKGLQTRQDSEDLADVLEVFQLCLLLGFHGRYRAGDQGELRGFSIAAGERINRIRGGFGALAAHAAPRPGEVAQKSRDPWLRGLLITAGTSWAVVFAMFLVLAVWLSRAAADVASAASVARPS